MRTFDSPESCHFIAVLPHRQSSAMRLVFYFLIVTASRVSSFVEFPRRHQLSLHGHGGSKHLPTPRTEFLLRSQSRLCGKKSPGNIERIPNEFSRTCRAERVLGNSPRQRDYAISIEATQGERIALAERFGLSSVDSLEADVGLRRELQGKGSSNRVPGVQVEGKVRAKVTQTCVRTNEDFDVDVEFALFAVVRPVASIFDSAVRDDADDDDLSELDNYFANERKHGSKRKQKSVRAPERNIDEMDMSELQQILQDFDVEDDVIEDESIYSMDGVIDVGELVSQLFWLNLDPYPKKPGTGPIQASITG